MTYRVYELNPVDRITTDATGEPGQRVFYLQARKGMRLVTVLCEKQQVAALGLAVAELLLALADNKADAVVEPDPAVEGKMGLEYPLQPVFRAGELSLGYDKVTERLVIVAYELVEEGEEERPSVARFWLSGGQGRALSLQAEKVVAAGRPTCAMCGEPIDPGGHFCPRRNGDR